jgi:integrase
MAGKVRSREKYCSECKSKLIVQVEDGEEKGIKCPVCNYRPQTYFIFIYWQGGKHRIPRDPDGHILDGYRRAHRLLESIRREIDAGTFNINNYLPKEIEMFRGHQLLEEWQRVKAGQGLSSGHLEKVRQYATAYYVPYFGALDCRKLITHHIESFMLTLPQHLSEKTKKNIMDMLKNFCRWLYRREIIARVPFFPVLSPPEPVIRVITRETQLKILEKISPRHRDIFRFLMYHPVRPSEACALKTKDIDLVNGIVEISRAFGHKHELKPRKNKKPYHLPLSNTFDPSVLRNKLPEAFVFVNSYGKPFCGNRLRKIWTAALIKAKVPHINLYNGTRHSIATDAVMRGVDKNRISQALGHSTASMADKYVKAKVDILRDIVNDPGPEVLSAEKKRF